MPWYGFILRDGKELEAHSIREHEQVAKEYVEKNYYKDYIKSGYTDYTDYMVLKLGAIKVGNLANPRSITVALPYSSNLIREMCKALEEDGFYIDEVIRRG